MATPALAAASSPRTRKFPFDPSALNRIPITSVDIDSQTHYNTLILNYRPQPQDGLEQITSYTLDRSGRPLLSIANVEPGAIPAESATYQYRGSATSNPPDAYFLIFDSKSNTCRLATVDTALAFNLSASPNPSSPDRPSSHPLAKLPTFTRQAAPEQEKPKESDGGSNWFENFSDEGDSSNPYDFRHFIEEPREASQSVTPPARSPSPNLGAVSDVVTGANPSLSKPNPIGSTSLRNPPNATRQPRSVPKPNPLRIGSSTKKPAIPEVKITKAKPAAKSGKRGGKGAGEVPESESASESGAQLPFPKNDTPVVEEHKESPGAAGLSDEDFLALVTAGLTSMDDENGSQREEKAECEDESMIDVDDAAALLTREIEQDDAMEVEEEGEEEEDIAQTVDEKNRNNEDEPEEFSLTPGFVAIPPLERIDPDARVIDLGSLDPDMDYYDEDEEDEHGRYVDVDDLFNLPDTGVYPSSRRYDPPVTMDSVSSGVGASAGNTAAGTTGRRDGFAQNEEAKETEDDGHRESRSFEEIVASLMESDDEHDDSVPSRLTMPEEEESDVSEEE